ncbi:MAG: AfsR/SARP family transcriptional regulator, partial [Caldilineaceae bacterium]
MTKLEIFLLGPPVVRWQGHFLSIPRRRVRALLFRLAVEMQPVSREHLATLFWCGVSDSVAHRDLSHLISHLRDALPSSDFVQAENDFVCLSDDLVWSDTEAFMGLFRQSHLHSVQPVDCDDPMPPPHPAPSAAELEAAALYRGPLMDGVFLDEGCDYDEWLTVERTVWERRFQMLFAAIDRGGDSPSSLGVSLQ